LGVEAADGAMTLSENECLTLPKRSRVWSAFPYLVMRI
jgi:hypothetical protein